jgi:osmotically-inducible protein OsmY
MNETTAVKSYPSMLRPLAALALAATLASSLQGCVGVMVGGAVAGAVAATDRRTLGAQTEDKGIEIKGGAKLSRVLGDSAHTNINSYNRKALLTGEVPNEEAKTTAENELRSVEGVVAVINELQVAGVSSYTARSNDALITGKVKAAFVDTKDLQASAFKVATEAGVVYLMGRVTQQEGNLAAEVARGVSGVRKVVKVYDYISETELKEIMANPPKQDPEKQN